MHHEIVMAGTGGQGIMVMGQLLAHAAVIEDKNVVWFPSYGPESRGGTANCTVIVSDEEIGSPVIATPGILIAASQMALDRYVESVKPEGVILINSSLVQVPTERSDCRIAKIPASEVADELGNYRIANMIMLGAFVGLMNPVKIESVCKALADVLPPHRHKLIPLNESALMRGMELVSKL